MSLHKDLTGTDLHVNKLHADTHAESGTDEITVTDLAGIDTDTTLAANSDLKVATQKATKAYADAAAAAAAGTYTDEKAQDAIGAMVDSTIVYTDATPLLSRAALTGDVTASGGSNATTIANDAVTYAKMQNVSAASKLLGRGSASGSGDPEEITLGSGLTMTATTLSASSGAAADDAEAIIAGQSFGG